MCTHVRIACNKNNNRIHWFKKKRKVIFEMLSLGLTHCHSHCNTLIRKATETSIEMDFRVIFPFKVPTLACVYAQWELWSKILPDFTCRMCQCLSINISIPSRLLFSILLHLSFNSALMSTYLKILFSFPSFKSLLLIVKMRPWDDPCRRSDYHSSSLYILIDSGN